MAMYIGTLIVMALLSVTTLSLGKVIDKHPKAESTGGYPAWSSPVPATRIFTAFSDILLIAGGGVMYVATDKYVLTLGIAMVMGAMLTLFTAAAMSFAVLSALNSKGKWRDSDGHVRV